jgi:hypothetical protein
MWLAFLINLTAYPVSRGLLPYVAQRVYHVGATGLKEECHGALSTDNHCGRELSPA